MIEKARRVAAFLFWYSQTSLPEVKFVLILHAWTKLSSSLCKHFFFPFFRFYFSKKKEEGVERCSYLFLIYLFRYPMYFYLMFQFLVH
jgi:hypothetical protein